MPSTSPSDDSRETAEARVAKALAHPLRARILERLAERVASPGELATELKVPLGVVSYHIRMLRQYECVELIRTEPVRGALQHFYRATALPHLDRDQWHALPATLRSELAGETMKGIVQDVSEAAAAGRLNERDVLVSRMLFDLDARASAKLNRLLGRTLKQALAIARESEARGGASVRKEVAMLHFRPEPSSEA